MEKYTQQLVNEAKVADGESYIISVSKLTGEDEPYGEDAWNHVRKSIDEANQLIDQDYTLEVHEFSRGKWDIRLKRVYVDGTQIES